MLWVSAADDANHALALNHLAVLTDRLDAAAYFHKKSSYGRAKSPWVPAGKEFRVSL